MLKLTNQAKTAKILIIVEMKIKLLANKAVTVDKKIIKVGVCRAEIRLTRKDLKRIHLY